VIFRLFRLFLLFFLPALVSVANAQGRWEFATNSGQENTGDPLLTRCAYQTIGGYRFSATYRGLCPFSVEVNPETGKVRTSQYEHFTSQDRWENASNIGQEQTGDSMLTRCLYQTIGGYRFSINKRGLCAFTVEVNPQSGKVNAPQSALGSSSGTTGRWESATNVGQEQTGDSMLTRCAYQTISGYRFTTTSRGLCKFNVHINPETRQVRE